ncbi:MULTISPECIES: hypothetical protein [Streptomyces]|uniref:hypothetical protein n=1 Tax=Streptomyces TaxID=1883 RepID=UPI001C5F9940|nr:MULTISPECIES: hypothetical protein [Streptomyces]MBW5253509.1 hypothetical protein [Streptomyces poriferorum]MBW5255321.1 hypothetical protein [Streptomyces poriferorum]WRZ02611.1 hypothetical protein OG959_04265 [Streptomyces sp. NBC_00385]
MNEAKAQMDTTAGSLRFAALADAALSQATYRGLETPAVRPEADVRRVAWWRVRGLQRAAHLPLLLGVLALNGAVLLIKAQHPHASVPFWIYSLPLLTAIVLGMTGVGCRRAVRMARAARLPGQRMRYTLLHSYASETPWLVLFDEAEDDDAKPLGMLPLRYGPLRNRFRELPSPVGKAALAGRLLAGAIAIPWIEGRPVWPESGFRPLDLGDPQHLRALSEMLRPE